MSFLFGRWRAVEDTKRIRELYPENGKLMTKGKKIPTRKVQRHSFSHLLNKRFPVEQLNLKPIGPPEKPQRSFRITDAQKVQQAMRNSNKLETSYDN